jgi:hypothetical protein
MPKTPKSPKLRLTPTAVSYSVALTIAQWEVLCAIEDIQMPNTRDWETKYKVDRIDWNGHFGPYVFFTAETKGHANRFLAFLQKTTKIPKVFLDALNHGESGKDYTNPFENKDPDYEYSENEQLNIELYRRGFDSGQHFGVKTSLTKTYDQALEK